MSGPVVQHIVTQDGSTTLYSPLFDEHYHSVHGAIQESMHVFIQAGLMAIPGDKSDIQILEMGFGTGLNALLSLLHGQNHQIRYTGIESYPLHWEQASLMNYPQELSHELVAAWYQKIHESPWEQFVEIHPGFALQKKHTSWESFQAEAQYDLVYFDAFAPNVQPELWAESVMSQLFSIMNPGGIFVTYSAKSSVRRGLQAAGFEVEKLPGPPGKREMLRALKKPE